MKKERDELSRLQAAEEEAAAKKRAKEGASKKSEVKVVTGADMKKAALKVHPETPTRRNNAIRQASKIENSTVVDRSSLNNLLKEVYDEALK